MKVKPSIEEYIESSAPFAQPILHFIRECMFEVNPNLGEEIKWNFPCFIYNGSILANMAGFKQHATLGFWMASEMKDPNNLFIQGENQGMGNFGKVKSLVDLPSKEILKSYIQEAMQLHDMGVKISPSVNKKAIPDNKSLLSALKSSDSASIKFSSFSPSQKGEYHEWINDAKTDTTRDKRIVQAIEWISEGKPRNWKHMKNWKGKS